MLKRLFKTNPATLAGPALYAAAVRQARTPALYATLGAPDTIEGRFELYSLHVYLLLARLKEQGPQAAETAQALFDAYVQALDDLLREMGVGDTSIARKMRKLGEAFYGRIKSYEEAMVVAPDTRPLCEMLARTVFTDQDDANPAPLAAYVLRQRDHLVSQPLQALLAGNVAWAAL